MKLVNWSFNGLEIVMMESPEGVLYCTSKQLSAALGVGESAVRTVRLRNKDEFNSLSVTKRDAKEFLAQVKDALGIKRLRADIYLWSEDEMILAAILTRSTVSKEFRKGLIQFVRDNARKNMVENEVHARVLIELGKCVTQIEELQRKLGMKNEPQKVQLRIVQ